MSRLKCLGCRVSLSVVSAHRWAVAVCTLGLVPLLLASSTWIDPETVLRKFPPDERVYSQLVDHFDYSLPVLTFNQRYWVYDKFWDNTTKDGPILFMFSGEGALEGFYRDTTVLFSSYAPELKALIVFLEHRYYGESKIFKADLMANKQEQDLKFLTIENALQDTAVFLSHFKKEMGCQTSGCQTFTFGGSYGGMLVGWFRFKYPHLTSGGVVSSGSLDYYDIATIAKTTWKNALSAWIYEGGIECADAVNTAISLMKTADAATLKDLFNICATSPPSSGLPGAGLAALLRYVKGAIASLSMIDYPFAWTLTTAQPARPVKRACDKLLNATHMSKSTLLSALNEVIDDYTGPLPCKNIEQELFYIGGNLSSTTRRQGSRNNVAKNIDMELWNYQACTQIPMMPLSTDLLGFYPPENLQELDSLKKACAVRYSVSTRGYEYLPLTYAGSVTHVQDDTSPPPSPNWIKLLSRVVIIDGALDTWRTGSLGSEVHQNTSDFVVIPPVKGAAHHQDLIAEHPQDTPELKAARHLIVRTLKQWLEEDRKKLS